MPNLRTGPGLVERLARGLLLRGVHEEGLNRSIVDHVDLPAGSDLLELQATHGIPAALDATEDDLGDVLNLPRGIDDDGSRVSDSGVRSGESFSGAVLRHVELLMKAESPIVRHDDTSCRRTGSRR